MCAWGVCLGSASQGLLSFTSEPGLGRKSWSQSREGLKSKFRAWGPLGHLGPDSSLLQRDGVPPSSDDGVTVFGEQAPAFTCSLAHRRGG